jgi:hypothetical protein
MLYGCFEIDSPECSEVFDSGDFRKVAQTLETLGVFGR